MTLTLSACSLVPSCGIRDNKNVYRERGTNESLRRFKLYVGSETPIRYESVFMTQFRHVAAVITVNKIGRAHLRTLLITYRVYALPDVDIV